MRRPSNGKVSSPYGMRIHPISGDRKMHYGEDIGHHNGTTLVAPVDAKVISYANTGGWGIMMTLRAKDGTIIRLAHTARALVSVGTEVREGEPVAIMGETGNAAGVHVHWEVLVDGKYVDPAVWVGSGAITTEEDDEMPIAILERKNSQLTKSLYNVTTGRAIRAISVDENTSFRKARSGAVVYVTVSDAEYRQRGGLN